MNNTWNRFIYTFWSPLYDCLIKAPLFVRGRERAWEVANVTHGEDVLLVGIGTGADIKYLADGATITGIDINHSMLNLAKKKAARLGKSMLFLLGDAEKIPRPDNIYDVVALNLILSVVPDPAQCFQEAVRVTKPGGRIIVFDKFLADGVQPSWKRKLANYITRPFGTDIMRRFEEMIQGADVTVVSDEPLSPGSAFRVILISC